MAQRRMFSLKIIDTDLFLDMPISSRLLYYDLSMRADDDGFVASPRKIQRMTGCSEDDLRLLTAKQFIIPFDTGVCVIKHWKMHNYIAKDRYTPTFYKAELAQLDENEGSYDLSYTSCIQNNNNLLTQDRIVKDRIGEDRKGESITPLKQSTLINGINPCAEKIVVNTIVEDVIDYMNHSLGKKYSAKGKENIRLIQKLFKEGRTYEDFKYVVDVKKEEWENTDFAQYLCTDTLFGNKFEKYLNQPMKKKGVVAGIDLDYKRKLQLENTNIEEEEGDKF